MVDLGKYFAAVVSAYGISLLALAVLVGVTWAQARASSAKLAAAEARREMRKIGDQAAGQAGDQAREQAGGGAAQNGA